MNYKARIKEKGLKITWLADKVGVSQSMISQVVKGEKNLLPEKESKLRELLR